MGTMLISNSQPLTLQKSGPSRGALTLCDVSIQSEIAVVLKAKHALCFALLP